MKINKPAIALASILALGSACEDSEDTTLRYPIGKGVVTKGAGNETDTEQKAAAHLQGGSAQKFECHDYSSSPLTGMSFPRSVDESRRRIDAVTRCANVNDRKHTIDVTFDKDEKPITGLY